MDRCALIEMLPSHPHSRLGLSLHDELIMSLRQCVACPGMVAMSFDAAKANAGGSIACAIAYSRLMSFPSAKWQRNCACLGCSTSTKSA